MTIRIRPVGARGGPRGMAEQDKAMSDAARNRIARAMKKAAKDAAPSGTRLSDQDLTRALNVLRGMVSPQKKKSGGKVKKAKGMAKGGKMKSKGMAKGGKMKSKGYAKGGKTMKKKSKGMARGGKMMRKSKGMARGGKAKR